MTFKLSQRYMYLETESTISLKSLYTCAYMCTVPPTRNLTTRASLARYPYASRPRAVESRPRGVESRPRAVESRPRAVESRPRAVESRPRAIESRPSAVESRPRAIESRSRAVESRPARMILNFLSCIFL